MVGVFKEWGGGEGGGHRPRETHGPELPKPAYNARVVLQLTLNSLASNCSTRAPSVPEHHYNSPYAVSLCG